MNLKLLSLLFLVTINLAHANSSEKLIVCIDIKEDSKRLSCYDSVMGLTKNKRVVVQETKPVEVISQEVTKLPKEAAPVAAIQKVDSDNTEKESEFGQEHKRVQEGPKELQFIVKSTRQNAYKEWRITLQNGQIWKQVSSASSSFKVKAGDEIVIKRGALNSFSMKKVGSKRSIKVKRTK